MDICNYHSHTFRCKHAKGDAIDYVNIANKGGAKVYGISDHAPTPDGKFEGVRMSIEELDGYQNSVNYAQKVFPQVKVLLALECEYFPEYSSFHKEELLGKRKFDYLIGAGHYTPLNGYYLNSYTEMKSSKVLVAYSLYLTKMMETGIYSFIAHPDIFGCSNLNWNEDLINCSRDILQAAEETNTPLEINGGGFRKKKYLRTKSQDINILGFHFGNLHQNIKSM